ncbi:hypothetical protein LPJ53_000466 [Coemansia erecta]|uniref:Ion transport domain-containing protein n=1 Tax=Coemansia erecta TaxID=147472 RepID=A0A9W8CTT1_9FUNG|nr:hypothetical protein LPJ53_000466 [Coemansia erecta]
MGFSTMVVLFFLIVFMIDTFPQYRVWAHWRNIARSVNLATAIFFAVEWVLRFYSFRHPLKYLIQPLSILDMLGIIPGFIYFYDDRANFLGRAKWLRALQVLRVLRVLRLTEYSVELYVTLRTLRKSLFQIIVVMMVIAIILLTTCFLMFFAENDRLDEVNVQWLRKNHGVTEPSPFQNVFFCLYWGFATITTVGYGDYTPVSPWGQVIASVTMFLGVFTIVFPTSIISNNFSTEWEAFHKAQKLHEQRLLQHEYEHKKRDLARVWSYANRSYEPPGDGSIPDGGRLPEGSPKTVNNISERTSVHSPDSSAGLLISDGVDNSGGNGAVPQVQNTSQPHNLKYPPPRPGSDVELDTQLMAKTGGKMAPFEYDRIMDITKKVEKNLGIPGVSLDEINTDSEVNQSLVVNAMYSKLYNDAFSTLCQRMLARLLSNRQFGSVDEIASFLQHKPASLDASDEWPRDEKLTMLEYKLLSYVFENISQSNFPIPELRRSGDGSAFNESGQAVPKSTHISSRHGIHRDAFRSSPNLRDYGKRPVVKAAKQRIKSKIAHAYQHLPMSREPSHQSAPPPGMDGL